jgi:hypothetical protein
MIFLILLLAVVGISNIIYEEIGAKYDFKPLNCPRCLGFWCGCLIYILFFGFQPLDVLIFGFAGSAISSLFHK